MQFAAIDEPFQQLQMKEEIGKAKFISFFIQTLPLNCIAIFYPDTTLKLHRN
jgi:hypothetical protein